MKFIRSDRDSSRDRLLRDSIGLSGGTRGEMSSGEMMLSMNRKKGAKEKGEG